jgi:hypothetical protein
MKDNYFYITPSRQQYLNSYEEKLYYQDGQFSDGMTFMKSIPLVSVI